MYCDCSKQKVGDDLLNVALYQQYPLVWSAIKKNKSVKSE